MNYPVHNKFNVCVRNLYCPERDTVNKKIASHKSQMLNRECGRMNSGKLTSGSEVFEYVTDGNGDFDVKKVLMNEVNQNLGSCLLELKNKYENIKKQQGVVGKAWDFIKNHIGLSREKSNKNNPISKIWARYFNADDGSKIIDRKIEILAASLLTLKQLARKSDVKNYEKVFEALTGKPFNPKSLDSLKLLKNTVFEKSVKKYNESQENGVDNISDFAIWGAAAVGSSVLPATGVIHILANSALCGATANSGLKALDKLSGGNKYKTFLTDIKDGAFAGVMNPVGDVLAVSAITSFAPVVGVKATKQFINGILPVDTVLSGGNILIHNLLNVLQSSITWGAYEGSISGYKTLLYSKDPLNKRMLNVAKDTAQWTGEGAFYGPLIDAALGAIL